MLMTPEEEQMRAELGLASEPMPAELALEPETGPTEDVNEETGEIILGFDSTRIEANCSGNINVQSQVGNLFIKRVELPPEICPHFLVTDVKVGRNSQLYSSGALPAYVFSKDNPHTFKPKLDMLHLGQYFTISVTNQSDKPRNFQGAVICRRLARVTCGTCLQPLPKCPDCKQDIAAHKKS